MAKPPRLKRPKVKRGRAIFFEDQEFDKDYEAKIGLTLTHPATFPLEFTNVIPPEIKVEKKDPPPNVPPRDQPAARIQAPDDSEQIIIRTRHDGTKVMDTHPLEDPSSRFY